MSTRFVFVTDSHYYPDALKDFGAPKMLTRGRPVMEAVVPAVNALQPDFIVHGGDLLCGGSSVELPRETYLRSIGEVAEVFAGFEAPFYCIPGNHDADAQHGSFADFQKQFSLPQPLTIVEAAPHLQLALSHIYHQCDPIEAGSGVWTDEFDLATVADFREPRVFGQEPVAGMDGIDIADFGRTDDTVDTQVAVATGGGTDAAVLVRELHG